MVDEGLFGEPWVEVYFGVYLGEVGVGAASVDDADVMFVEETGVGTVVSEESLHCFVMLIAIERVHAG